jgi:hypothetical protein
MDGGFLVPSKAETARRTAERVSRQESRLISKHRELRDIHKHRQTKTIKKQAAGAIANLCGLRRLWRGFRPDRSALGRVGPRKVLDQFMQAAISRCSSDFASASPDWQ